MMRRSSLFDRQEYSSNSLFRSTQKKQGVQLGGLFGKANSSGIQRNMNIQKEPSSSIFSTKSMLELFNSKQNSLSVQTLVKRAQNLIQQKLKLLRPVEETIAEFQTIFRNLENKLTQQIINIYEMVNFSQQVESLKQMDQELKNLNQSFSKGKEEWKKNAVQSMANSIIQEIDPIKPIVVMNQNLFLRGLQHNLGIDQKGEPKQQEKQEVKFKFPKQFPIEQIPSSRVKEINIKPNLPLQFMSQGTRRPADDVLVSKDYLLVYFSAFWCPQCHELTPLLKKCYNKWNQEGKSVEVILGSMDDDNQEFVQYYSQMPWLAYPLHDKNLSDLKDRLKIEQVPSLAVFKKGRLVTTKGRADLLYKGEKAIEKWS